MGLPNGYTQLEWIQGTGTQYVNSGVSARNITKVEIGIIPQSDGLDGDPIYGAEWGANGYFLIFYQKALRFHSFGGSVDVNYTVGAANTITTTQTTITSNGTQYPVGSSGPNTSSPLLLFNCNGLCGRFKLLYCRIYENGALVRDYVPAKRSDGTVGLLDVKNNVFYANAGSGSFVAGPEVVVNLGHVAAGVDGINVSVTHAMVNTDGIERGVSHLLVNVDGVLYEIPLEEDMSTEEMCKISSTSIYVLCDVGDGTLKSVLTDNVEVELGTIVSIGFSASGVLAGDAYVDGTAKTMYSKTYSSGRCYMVDVEVMGDITVAYSTPVSMRARIDITTS